MVSDADINAGIRRARRKQLAVGSAEIGRVHQESLAVLAGREHEAWADQDRGDRSEVGVGRAPAAGPVGGLELGRGGERAARADDGVAFLRAAAGDGVAGGEENVARRVVDDHAPRRPDSFSCRNGLVDLVNSRPAHRHARDPAVIWAAIAPAAAERNINVRAVVRECERAALLLDGPGKPGRRDLGLQLDRAGRQIESEQPVRLRDVPKRHEVDPPTRDVDDAGAQDARRVDVAATPSGGLRRADGGGGYRPDDRAVLLVQRVDVVLQRRDVNEAVVDQGLRVDLAVEHRGCPARRRARSRWLRAVVAGVRVVVVVHGPAAVGDGGGGLGGG